MSEPELQRSRDEIQRAHDLLVNLIASEELRTTLFDGEILDRMLSALDALCWVLRHDHNVTFAVNLLALEGSLRAMGVEMRRAGANEEEATII